MIRIEDLKNIINSSSCPSCHPAMLLILSILLLLENNKFTHVTKAAFSGFRNMS